METSMRFGSGGAKSLRIHAKEKFPIDSHTNLEVHGEYDVGIGSPSYFSGALRHYYPHVGADLGVAVRYGKKERLRYSIRGKKAFAVADGSPCFHLKGQCDVDKEFREKKSRGAAEISWSVLRFQSDQDVRFKIGYEIFGKLPYVQVRENNWTFHLDGAGHWSVKFVP